MQVSSFINHEQTIISELMTTVFPGIVAVGTLLG